MRMVHGVLFTAGMLGGTMAIRAQGEQPALQGLPQYGITLSGSPENLVLENLSGRVVIGYDVRLADANGGHQPPWGRLFPDRRENPRQIDNR